MSNHFHPLITQSDANTALNRGNEAAQRLIAAKNESGGLQAVEAIRLKSELDIAKRALNDAEAMVAEWQAAMFAWKDLAQTLRDEIKACPNHEAHKFGKDDKARSAHFLAASNSKRVELGLKPVK